MSTRAMRNGENARAREREGERARERDREGGIIKEKETRGTGMKRRKAEKEEFTQGAGRARETEERGARRGGQKVKREKETRERVLRDGKAFSVAGNGGINRSKGKLFGRGVTSQYLRSVYVRTYTYVYAVLSGGTRDVAG